jgi:hypothetical protein
MLNELKRQRFQTLARSLSGKDSLIVTLGKACSHVVSGEMIFLNNFNQEIVPGIPASKGECLIVQKATCAHESAHIRYTDLAAWETAVQRGQILSQIVNILEDARIESIISEVFPGARDWLRFCNTYYLLNCSWDSTGKVFCVYTLTGKMPKEASKEIRTLVKQCDPFIEQARNAATTWDVLEAAKKIYDLLKEKINSFPELPPPKGSYTPEQAPERQKKRQSSKKIIKPNTEKTETEDADNKNDQADAEENKQSEPHESQETTKDSHAPTPAGEETDNQAEEPENNENNSDTGQTDSEQDTKETSKQNKQENHQNSPEQDEEKSKGKTNEVEHSSKPESEQTQEESEKEQEQEKNQNLSEPSDENTDEEASDPSDKAHEKDKPKDKTPDDKSDTEYPEKNEGPENSENSEESENSTAAENEEVSLNEFSELIKQAEEEVNELEIQAKVEREPLPDDADPQEIAKNLKGLHENIPFVIAEGDIRLDWFLEPVKPLIHQAARDIQEGLLYRKFLPERNLRKGTLHPGSLWKLRVADPRVFQKIHQPSTIPDVAIYMLLDCSGSMCSCDDNNKARYKHACEATNLLVGVCKELNIPCAVTGFVDKEEHVVHFPAMKFNGKGSNHITITGCNRDGFSIRIAAGEISVRPEKKKIIIVISDGLPNYYHHSGYCTRKECKADTALAVRQTIKKGIGVIGIHIGDIGNLPDIQKIYPTYIHLEKVEHLSKIMGKVLKKIILEER